MAQPFDLIDYLHGSNFGHNFTAHILDPKTKQVLENTRKKRLFSQPGFDKGPSLGLLGLINPLSHRSDRRRHNFSTDQEWGLLTCKVSLNSCLP